MNSLFFTIGKLLGPSRSIIAPMQRIWRMVYSGYCASKFRSFDSTSRIEPYMAVLLGAENIVVGKNTYIGANAELTTWKNPEYGFTNPCIEIGDGCIFNSNVHITCVNHIKIGNNVLTGRRVTITDNSHGECNLEDRRKRPIETPIVSKGPVEIGDRVWIGENVCILPGVTIGEGAVIAASSVVTKSIPSYCVAGGNPAKILKDMKS